MTSREAKPPACDPVDLRSDNIRIVEDMLYGLQDRDLDTVERLLAEDVVYHNVGYHRPVRGRRKTMKIMSAPGLGFGVKIHRVLADDTTVTTERTDAMIVGPLHIQFWVCGVFEVRDGRITLWRDYFDLLAVVRGLGRALVSLAIPSLRPTL